jgi:hypothetical protein
VFTQEGADSFVRFVIGLISLLICLGLFLVYMYAKKYAALFHTFTGEPYLQAVLADTTLAIAFPMWIVALVAVLVSHSLFPDETDFRVLMPLPLDRRVVFVAKLAALALFAGVFTITAHLALTPLAMLISGGPWSTNARPFGVLVFWVVGVAGPLRRLLFSASRGGCHRLRRCRSGGGRKLRDSLSTVRSRHAAPVRRVATTDAPPARRRKSRARGRSRFHRGYAPAERVASRCADRSLGVRHRVGDGHPAPCRHGEVVARVRRAPPSG